MSKKKDGDIITKKTKLCLLILIGLYSLIILYFLFVGFGRTSNPTAIGYRFNFIPSLISLRLPIQQTSYYAWLFDFGNLVAFIPFGILIPMIRKTVYVKFILSFIVCISVIELIQMISYLGSADIDDVILNSLGATIGYFAYYISTKLKVTLKLQLISAGFIAFIIVVFLLTCLSH